MGGFQPPPSPWIFWRDQKKMLQATNHLEPPQEELQHQLNFSFFFESFQFFPNKNQNKEVTTFSTISISKKRQIPFSNQPCQPKKHIKNIYQTNLQPLERCLDPPRPNAPSDRTNQPVDPRPFGVLPEPRIKARQMATRCFCPPESRPPRGPTWNRGTRCGTVRLGSDGWIIPLPTFRIRWLVGWLRR